MVVPEERGVLLMWVPRFRRGKEYRSRQLGNATAAGLGSSPAETANKVTANDSEYALAA